MSKEKLLLQYSMVAVMERLEAKLLYRLFLISLKAEHILMLKVDSIYLVL